MNYPKAYGFSRLNIINGADASLLVPEETDISLSERCSRVNAYCKAHGSSSCILRHTLCSAVLTENLFMTNADDLTFIESHAGQQAIIDLHVEGICEFICR